jgi:hypothetical protein
VISTALRLKQSEFGKRNDVIKFSLTLAVSLLSAASAPAAASPPAVPAPFVCPVKHPVPQAQLSEVPEVIDTEMEKRFDAVMADNKSKKVKGEVHATTLTVRPALMSALAQVTGCGALIDKEESCSRYFSPEVGSPIAIFMDMKKTHPLRKQFELAIQALPNRHEREAALHCIKLTGK